MKRTHSAADETTALAHPLLNDALLLLRQRALLQALEKVLSPANHSGRATGLQAPELLKSRPRGAFKNPGGNHHRRQRWAACRPRAGSSGLAHLCVPICSVPCTNILRSECSSPGAVFSWSLAPSIAPSIALERYV